jgi:proline iminopeptidase
MPPPPQPGDPVSAGTPTPRTLTSGTLETGDGQSVFWESWGSPDGVPAVFLHGGPGSGFTEGHRQHFDARRHRVVALDQRGCGRSRPLATDPGADLSAITTAHMVADVEALREHLGIDAWLVVGVSWGTTLALAYAQAHPDRVTGLVLGAVTTTSAAEVEWITESMRAVFPAEWEDFAAASGRAPGQRVVDAYRERLTDPDPAVREAAARAWCTWEDVHVSLATGGATSPRYEDPEFRLLFATLVVHVWAAAGFAPPGGLLGHVDRVAHLPGVLVHGALDISSPLSTAFDLHRAWPGSELVVVRSDGHGGASMAEEITGAVDRLTRR